MHLSCHVFEYCSSVQWFAFNNIKIFLPDIFISLKNCINLTYLSCYTTFYIMLIIYFTENSRNLQNPIRFSKHKAQHNDKTFVLNKQNRCFTYSIFQFQYSLPNEAILVVKQDSFKILTNNILSLLMIIIYTHCFRTNYNKPWSYGKILFSFNSNYNKPQSS